jgi:hypothetical protein
MRCLRLLLAAALPLAAAVRGLGVAAVPLPDPGIPGFQYPEAETTLLGWVQASEAGGPGSAAASDSLYLHGWGLWTALNEETNEIDGSDTLRVFETWFTPQEIDEPPANPVPTRARVPIFQRMRAPLGTFGQFERGLGPRDRELLLPPQGSETVFGYVKFDPTATAHVVQQQLLSTKVLGQLLAAGEQQIPVFPNTAITLKSAFQLITAKTLVGGRYYRLNAWTGPPAAPQAWPPYAWPGVVWIDLQGGGSGNGQVDRLASTDGGSRTDETTYPISSMIHHQVTALEASQFNAMQPGSDVKPGDYAVLVAMHVAGREITRWTWQTFWWSPSPDDPQLPSSQSIAAVRPQQLTGAARHYAMALGYDMSVPGQPSVGGANTGSALYVYNPYLEARFAPANLPDSLPGRDPNGQPATNNFGVQCNCMSCHLRATFNPNGLATAPRYSGARYTDLTDPQFDGTLQVDLLWSLPEIAH